jgi:glycosyltransferase involved in cell wall biosynthesis
MSRRICFVNRYCYPDGSATSQLMADLAGELSSRGWQVTMVGSTQRYDDPGTRLARKDRWRGVEILRVDGTRFGRASLLGRAVDYLSFYLRLPFVLWRTLRRGDLLVAKTDPPMLAVFAGPVAKIRGATMVNWLQDLFPEIAVALGQPKLPGPAVGLLRRLRNRASRKAALNVVIGERMGELLAREGVAPGKIAVVPNWSHEDAIRPLDSQDSRLRARLGLQDRFVVGYSGNLGRAHEWKPLFEAAQALAGLSTPIAFLVGGGGHGYDALKAEVERAGLDNIHFQPYHPMEYLSDSMAAADLHLVSLRPELEGLIVPSKFYGIAAAARPVAFVGDPDGELARLIRQHDCGVAVPAGRGDLLAAAVLAMAADPECTRRQGGNARRLLDSHFSRAAAHDQWHHLLIGVAGARANLTTTTGTSPTPS